MAGASSLSDVSNVIYSIEYRVYSTVQCAHSFVTHRPVTPHTSATSSRHHEADQMFKRLMFLPSSSAGRGQAAGTSTDQPLPHFLPSDSFHVSHFRITPATFQILEKKYFCSCSKMELTDRCGGGEIVPEDQLQYSGAGEMRM